MTTMKLLWSITLDQSAAQGIIKILVLIALLYFLFLRSHSLYLVEYADPYDPTRAKPIASDKPLAGSVISNLFGTGRYPLEQRIENKKRGIGRQKHPLVVWALTATMVAVFIYELVSNWRAQGTPVSFKVLTTFPLIA